MRGPFDHSEKLPCTFWDQEKVPHEMRANVGGGGGGGGEGRGRKGV